MLIFDFRLIIDYCLWSKGQRVRVNFGGEDVVAYIEYDFGGSSGSQNR
jgi:hypothetical protein